jgi:RNA polymerase sigma-70 factor (ECF subfamily)
VRAATFGNLLPRVDQFTSRVDDVGLDAVCRGDVEAFAKLFARFQGPIFRYAAHMCGRDAADDVVQETFLALLRRPDRYDSTRGTVVSYLFGIARHFVLKRLTSREVASLDGDPDEHQSADPVDQPTVLDSLTREETIDAVRVAIQSLPPAYREVVVLCELQEMSYAAAADVVQCPVGTVRSRLHRARSLLVMKLSPSATGSRK